MSTLPQMTCREFVEHASDYLEGALDPRDRGRLEAHLADCAHCDEYLDQLRLTLELTGDLREDDVSPRMRSELLDVFSRWRDDAEAD